jgi:hypothetical protein
MTFDKAHLKLIRTSMQEALDSAGIKDVTIKVGNCSYNGGEATYKIQVLLDGAETQEQSSLSQMAGYFNLDTTKIAEIQGHKVSLYGYNGKARKMPWQVQSLDGKDKWKLTDEQVRRLFEKDYVS